MKKNILLGLFIALPLQGFGQYEATLSLGQYTGRRCIDCVFNITAAVISSYIVLRMVHRSSSSSNETNPQIKETNTEINETNIIDTSHYDFDSVAGADAAKEELAEVVDFLKHSSFYDRLGAKIPRGILLTGEPGNGKTLLAKAVAGEAKCPFIYANGSEFIELYVGTGAARVRELFKKARECAPCIIFIDEIDAIGSKRPQDTDGGSLEYTQTLNQLLSEMDGFIENNEKPIIIIGATNRPEALDKALLRPGRFDRKVEVPYPNLKDRKEILEIHMQNVLFDDSINIDKIAAGTPGFSGAELANLVNEATIMATRKGLFAVTMKEFDQARDKILLGKENKTMSPTKRDLTVTAFHEAGHALIRLLLPEYTDPLYKVTIVPRGNALGVTHSLPDREKYSTTKEEMLASIQIALGGRIAEELMCNEIGTGVYSDFKTASNIAREMVCYYGMSDLGPVIYDNHGNYSPETADKIEQEIRKIVNECYQKAQDLLKEHKSELTILANALLDHQTLYADEIYDILTMPHRANHRLK